MLPGSILVAWRMAVAHSSQVGEKVHMKARAPDIMAAYGILFAPATIFIAIATGIGKRSM